MHSQGIKIFTFIIVLVITPFVMANTSYAAPLVNLNDYIRFCSNSQKNEETTNCVGMGLARFLTLMGQPDQNTNDAFMMITGNERNETQGWPGAYSYTEYQEKLKPLLEKTKRGETYIYIKDYNEGITVQIAKKSLMDANPTSFNATVMPGAQKYEDYIYIWLQSCGYTNAATNSVCHQLNNTNNTNYSQQQTVYVFMDYSNSGWQNPTKATETQTGGLFTNDQRHSAFYMNYSEKLPAFTITAPTPKFDIDQFKIPLQECTGDLIDNAICWIKNGLIAFLNLLLDLILPSDSLLSHLEDGSDILSPLIYPQGNYPCNLHILGVNQDLCYAASNLKQSQVIQIGQKVSVMALLIMPIFYIINRMTNRQGNDKL